MKIGFFDSGVGGLTILASVRKLLPQYDYLFYGDTAHVPYGDRSEGEIHTLTQNAIEFLLSNDCALVVVACNTASAETLRKLQDTILSGAYNDRRLLGVIVPTVETLVSSKTRSALFVGTTRTINSKKYDTELNKLSSAIVVESIATPELVPLIESGKYDDAYQVIDSVIQPRIGKADTIVLGCTHYTTLKKHIREKFKIQVISQDEIIPDKLKEYLQRHPEIETKLSREHRLEIVLSKENEHYTEVIDNLLAA